MGMEMLEVIFTMRWDDQRRTYTTSELFYRTLQMIRDLAIYILGTSCPLVSLSSISIYLPSALRPPQTPARVAERH